MEECVSVVLNSTRVDCAGRGELELAQHKNFFPSGGIK